MYAWRMMVQWASKAWPLAVFSTRTLASLHIGEPAVRTGDIERNSRASVFLIENEDQAHHLFAGIRWTHP